MVPPDILGNQNSFLSSIDWYWRSKGTTPKRFSTVDKNTFGTPCQIRLIRGGPQIYWLNRNSASNSVRTLFPWYIVIKCLVLPIQDGQPCLKNIPLKIVSECNILARWHETWNPKMQKDPYTFLSVTNTIIWQCSFWGRKTRLQIAARILSLSARTKQGTIMIT